MTDRKIIGGSFRDPSGFVFHKNGSIYRQINESYKQQYDRLIDSGLYQKLLKMGLIIPHEEITNNSIGDIKAYKVIKPEKIAFISYPYEWCFSQLKDAALATLAIQKTAFEFGMTLKDASAYNIQFHNGKPILIDTLSFEEYQEGQPWIAYKQFCQHFLAPLALMSFTDVRLNQLLRIHIDGIPLDLASRLLPFRSHLKLSLLSHIHIHSKSQKHFADKTVETKRKMSRRAIMGLISNLDSTVRSLHWKPADTEWGDYYDETNYSRESFCHKGELVSEFLDEIKPRSLWDIGANTGHFSRIASSKGIDIISFDIDPAAVEKNYVSCRDENISRCLPLLIDLTNPNPGIGWANEERMSLIERGPADCMMALALIHHLAISNNLPLKMVAELFGRLCRWLAIEFVPKSDSQVKRLFRTRKDIFPDYTQDGFEKAFREYFSIKRVEKIGDSDRTLYLMRKQEE